MASLSLPPPRKTPAILKNRDHDDVDDETESSNLKAEPAKPTASPQQRAPSYEERCRTAAQAAQGGHNKPFVPRSLQDFDDGGAFPEIHVAQYPRHMGNPHLQKNKSQAIVVKNVEIDKEGKVSYDSIVKGGTNQDKLVYSRHEDLKGLGDKGDVALPTPEEEAAETARTEAALQALLSNKTALDKPKGSAMVQANQSRNIQEKTQFIQYTPNPDAPGYNPAAARRVIQTVPAQVDPMMPPKHKHIKAPRGPAEDPVPVLHAPPTKLTKEEKAAWNVPACISNWKNMRGYTIPLDKRLAADGRGLIDNTTINSNFATLSESLYVAERQARQEVRLRASVQKKLALQEKEQREEELRQLAQQARMERGGGAVNETTAAAAAPADSDDVDDGSLTRVSHEETEDQVAARQRERMRMERKREREWELRREQNVELKKKRLEEERDVSEKIALGVHTGTGGGGEVDSRLYNQSGGLDSGFGPDDEYNTYSKPLFEGVSSASIYRPTRGETEYNADEQYDKLVKTSKFQPDKGFAGAEGGTEMQAGPRSAPVQFEKASK